MKKIIRSDGSGVWYADVVKADGDAYTLTAARRIWEWFGANTLSDIALSGCGAESKITRPVDEVIVYSVLEATTCTDEAVRVLDGIRPW